jgi:hypothetical protein
MFRIKVRKPGNSPTATQHGPFKKTNREMTKMQRLFYLHQQTTLGQGTPPQSREIHKMRKHVGKTHKKIARELRNGNDAREENKTEK